MIVSEQIDMIARVHTMPFANQPIECHSSIMLHMIHRASDLREVER